MRNFPSRKSPGVAEQAIEDAMARGDFDNLKGKGRPLNLQGDLADKATMSGKLRQNAGFGAPWEDAAREIEWLERRVRTDVQSALLRRKSALESPKADPKRIEAQFGEAKKHIELQIAAINSAILKHNLLLPSQLPALYKKRVSWDDFLAE